MDKGCLCEKAVNGKSTPCCCPFISCSLKQPGRCQCSSVNLSPSYGTNFIVVLGCNWSAEIKMKAPNAFWHMTLQLPFMFYYEDRDKVAVLLQQGWWKLSTIPCHAATAVARWPMPCRLWVRRASSSAAVFWSVLIAGQHCDTTFLKETWSCECCDVAGLVHRPHGSSQWMALLLQGNF